MTQFFASTRQETELFEAFFSSGMEESISPFITPSSRSWGKNIRLKGSIIAAIVLALSVACLFLPSMQPLAYLLLLLAYFFAGIPSLIKALYDLLDFEINIDVLMILAAFLSLFIGSGFEGALLLVLFSFSNSLEKAVSFKAKRALHALKKLSPVKASIFLPNGTLQERSVKDIRPGTRIFVKPGQVIPLDGTIVEGSSSLDCSHLTGESLPFPVQVGDVAQAGSSNIDGALTLQVSHVSSESTLCRIIQMIQEASEAKPRLQRWFDSVINQYAIFVMGLALVFAISFPFIFDIPFLGTSGSIYRALAFLIAASPCALILAVPIAYLSALSSCASKGVLLKGGIVLDALKRCKILAMDKTGTLTEGSLECIGVETSDLKQALPIAFALEQSIDHPIAQAICSYAKAQGFLPAKIESFKSKTGQGVEALYEGQRVILGQPAWVIPMLPEQDQTALQQKVENYRDCGESVALMVYKDQLCVFRLKDHLREKVPQTLTQLKKDQHLRLVMLTGDHLSTAQRIAKEAGIEEVRADLKPEDKLRLIEELSVQEGLVMVGDGINDAPALARASVGIAMGGIGTHVATEAADVILLNDRIDYLTWLFKKADLTTRIVTQNVILAAAAIIVAILPALLGFLPLWFAVLLHEGGTVIVGLNALRLLKQ